MPRHLCALCGQISFATYHEYEKHRAEVHNMKTAVKPENVTGRHTGIYREGGKSVLGTIVGDAENTWLKPSLIVNDTPEEPTAIVSNTNEHLPACRCMPLCFNKALDALIASQEEALKNQGVSHAE